MRNLRIRMMALLVAYSAAAMSTSISAAFAEALPDAASLLKPGQPSGPQGDSWDSIKKLPDFASGLWVGAAAPRDPNAVAPANGGTGHHRDTNMGWTPAWAVKIDAANAISARGGDVPSRAYHCIPMGFSGGFAGNFASPIQIAYSLGQVLVIPETNVLRRIYTDGRKHDPDPDLTFMGESVGHWENGTLVVDTIGLDPGNEMLYGIPGGNGMHVVERIHLSDANTIEVESVLQAPEALTRPWVRRETLKRHFDYKMLDDYCIQNNRDVSSSGTQQFDLTPPQ